MYTLSIATNLVPKSGICISSWLKRRVNIVSLHAWIRQCYANWETNSLPTGVLEIYLVVNAKYDQLSPHIKGHIIYLIISITTWPVTIDIYMETIYQRTMLRNDCRKPRMIVFQKYFYFSNKMEIILVTRISTLYFLFNSVFENRVKQNIL